MVDKPIDLSYGHLGEAFYDRNSQRWRFQRIPGVQSRLRVIGKPMIIVKASIQHVDHNQKAQGRKTQINKLTEVHPELAPAADVITHVSKEPEAALDSRSSYLYSASELLIFGEILDRGNRKQIQIAAVVAGANANSVRLVPLENSTSLSFDEGSFRPTSQRFGNTTQPIWVCGKRRIEQLSFSTLRDHGQTFLAVRTRAEVSILRPSFRTHPDVQGLGIEELTRIPMSGDEGIRPIAFAFDPNHYLQFLIASEDGRWSIYRLIPPPPKSLRWTSVHVSKGSLFKDPEDLLCKRISQTDHTWGSCLWIHHPEALVLASRHTLCILLLGSKSGSFNLSKEILRDGQDLMVDLKLALGDIGHLVIVTTSRIMIVELDEHAPSSENAKLPASILVAWRHFRDVGDLTLRLEVFTRPALLESTLDPKKDILECGSTMEVILYSRSTGIITLYGFRRDLALPNLVISTHDPYLLNLNTNTFLAAKTGEEKSLVDNRNNDEPSLLGVKMRLSNLKVLNDNDEFCNRDVLDMLILFDNLSVSRYHCTNSICGDEIEMSFTHLSSRSEDPSLSEATATEDEMESFIVPDRQNTTLLRSFSPSDLTDSDVVNKKGGGSPEDPWTLDCCWLARDLERHSTSSSEVGVGSPLQGLIDLIFRSHGRLGQGSGDDGQQIRSL